FGDHFSTPSVDEVKSRPLSHSEALESLCTLGKCDSGLKYPFLAMDDSDRHLSDVSIIPIFKNVIRVNVSGNHLTTKFLKVLSSMSFLLILETGRNCLSGSLRMDPLPYLRVYAVNLLFYHGTKTIYQEQKVFHPLLGTLELNYNRIADVSLDPEILKRIKVLELRRNILWKTNGIYLPSLLRLYIANNEIERLEGLKYLVNLKILHLRDIRLLSFHGFQNGSLKVTYLNLRSNKMKRISELTGLENVKRIDKDPVLENERHQAASHRQQMLDDGMSFSEFDVHDIEGDE
ncbi:leucine-rich repeat-containing protein 23-like, partial [Belonocnema kinseyi]|uniref:leucine-rich repeat-containing protein 23-like n=1 Tax=Belonocnema kinseyi TaxID=2817044 RepID=UPI00143DEAD7